MPWLQSYDPLGSPLLSTIAAGLPIFVLLGLLAAKRVRAHYAALAGLFVALAVAVGIIGMPVKMALASAAFGAMYGLLPIGWIILNVIFLYQLAEQRGLLLELRNAIRRVTTDPRLQLLLIAFCFGAFFEGTAGFGTPVAITGALLIGLGFPPLQASGLSLIANTAPVAFGALGTPIIALQGVTGLNLQDLSAMVGRQLPIFSVIVPAWLIAAHSGWRGVRETWVALLVAGVSFAVPQFLVSNYHGPWLVDIVASLCSISALMLYLRLTNKQVPRSAQDDKRLGVTPFMPWIVLMIVVGAWGLPVVKTALNGVYAPKIPIAGLDKLVLRAPPVVLQATAEPAVFSFNILSASGTAILLTAIITSVLLRYKPSEVIATYGKALTLVAPSLLTIAAMLALGYTTRYSGEDVILGLAFARTGVAYPFFGTLLGWLGVALTGSDTSSNVLFGSLQRVTAQQVGVSPILMAAANSSGGVMGKMIDAQSIVVASTATRWYGHEWKILRFVLGHSVALAVLVGILVLLQAYVAPFTSMVVR